MTARINLIRKIYQFFVDIAFEPGKIINERYEITRVIGMGSYGIVYECRNLNTGQKTALKQLRPSKRKNPEEVGMFEKEISIFGVLKHKQIPALQNHFIFEGHRFYVMDFIEGKNLEDVLFRSKRVFTEKESLLLIRRLFEVVDFLHQHDVYHGDLRIANVILQNGFPILIDFGLAENFCAGNHASSSRPSLFKKGKHSMTRLQLQQDDYYDLGDLLLFLLYSSFPGKSKKALPWIEELSLKPSTTLLLKHLLGIDQPYNDAKAIFSDLDICLESCGEI